MRHQILLALQIALAWYFVLSASAALLFLAWGPALRRWLRKGHGATATLATRLFPAGGSIAFVVLAVLPAFAWLEPFGSAANGERLGVAGTALFVSGALLLFFSVGRGAWTVFATRQRMRALNGHATRAGVISSATIFVSESAVPCVVLDGLWWPRLFVSRPVLDTLTPEELDCAIAHELAHHRAQDNLKRRMLAFAPDFIAGSRLARELEAAWKHSAEVEADEVASNGSKADAITLASALIKVARLSDGHPRVDLGRAAFHDGAPVADRIRILCTHPDGRAPRAARVNVPAALAVLAGGALFTPWLLSIVHQATEWLVRLP